jgi:hypothetical protein
MAHANAAEIALLAIDRCGYDVDNPEPICLDLDLDDTESLWERWQGNPSSPKERKSLLLSLLGTSVPLPTESSTLMGTAFVG